MFMSITIKMLAVFILLEILFYVCGLIYLVTVEDMKLQDAMGVGLVFIFKPTELIDLIRDKIYR